MKFSIIIACYNLGGLVCRALESCIHQESISLDEYEIIAINDGSTDNTLAFINKYSYQPNLRIIDKPNAGLSDTRNMGLSLAKGDYVLFLDGDDWYTQDALACLKENCGNYDVVVFPMYYYYSEDDYKTNLVGLHKGVYSRNTFLHATLGRRQFCIIPAQKKAYKRTFLKKNNIQFINNIIHEDNPFFLDVMNATDKVFYIDKPLYYYLQKREGSITACHTLKNFYGVISGLEHIDTLMIENNPDVRLLNGNMLVFQATQNYKYKEDAKIAFRQLRKERKRIIKYLFTSTFDLASFIRLLVLFVDPFFLKLIYKKK